MTNGNGRKTPKDPIFLYAFPSLASHHDRTCPGILYLSHLTSVLLSNSAPPPNRPVTSLGVASETTAISSASADGEWSPRSWKEPAFVAKQMPVYDDEEELSNAVSHLESCSPLVFAGEVRTLHEQLARATPNGTSVPQSVASP